MISLLEPLVEAHYYRMPCGQKLYDHGYEMCCAAASLDCVCVAMACKVIWMCVSASYGK